MFLTKLTKLLRTNHMEELKSRFLGLRDTDKYQRYSATHPVAWYIGLDGRNRYSLFAITIARPKPVNSTKLMNVFIGERKDGDYGITFSLIEKKNLDLFVHFCEDMIAFSENSKDPKNVADYICSRYIQWQKAFVKTEGNLLSYEQIKGLMGELCVLKMKMMPMYGVEKAIESWSGIEATDRDFACDDTWFEVKATVSGSPSVKISSVEQLDVPTEGHLIVVALDKTSEADSSKLTLNSMVDLVVESIPSKVSQERLLNRLLAYGYYRDKAYDHIGFKFNGMTSYKVDSHFPCLRKASIPASVQNAKYELLLAAIEAFKED